MREKGRERLIVIYKPLPLSSSFIHHSHLLSHPPFLHSSSIKVIDKDSLAIFLWAVIGCCSRALKSQQCSFVLSGQQPSLPQQSTSWGRRDCVWQLLPHNHGFSQNALYPLLLKYSLWAVKIAIIIGNGCCLLCLSWESKVRVTSCLSVVID